MGGGAETMLVWAKVIQSVYIASHTYWFGWQYVIILVRKT